MKQLLHNVCTLRRAALPCLGCVRSCVAALTPLRNQVARAPLAVAAAALTLCVSTPAVAYRTAGDLEEYESDTLVRWQDDTLTYKISKAGLPKNVGVADWKKAVSAALSVWEKPRCSTLEFSRVGTTNKRAKPDDGVNTIQLVTSGWTKLGYKKSAAGATDVLYERTGDVWRIVEADIYLNAQHHNLSLDPGAADAGKNLRDLSTVLTHEAGHFLGLLHPCEPGGKDGAPDCNKTSKHDSSLLFPYYESGARLSADDRAGVCALYGASGADTGAADHWGADAGMSGAATSAGRSGAEGQPGDPCTRDSNCATGACTNDGFCSCDESSETTCHTGAFGHGESCELGVDCTGAKCVAVEGEGSTCTRECDESLPCPGRDECREIDGENVCVPPTAASCSLFFTPLASRGSEAFLLLFPLLMLRRMKVSCRN